MNTQRFLSFLAGGLLLAACISIVSACGPICNENTGVSYTDIQAAIDASVDGNTIIVDGVSLAYPPFHVTKPLTIRGQKVLVDLPWVSSDTGNAITIDGSVSNVIIDNFSVTAASGPNGNGVYIPAGSSNNILSNLTVEGYIANIVVDGANQNTIQRCTLTGGHYGIDLYGSQNTVRDSSFSQMDAAGISLGLSPSDTLNTIHGNTFTEITPGAAINVYSPDNTIDTNTFTNDAHAITTYASYGTHNLIYNNIFRDSPVDNAADTGNTNIWNTVKVAGPNILGGPYLGGNYWASPGAFQGFSLTCTDGGDGICTTAFIYPAMRITDNLSLAAPATPSPGSIIGQGATVFIGEYGLNVTHALNAAQGSPPEGEPVYTTIGWWTSDTDPLTTPPAQTVNLASTYKNFDVTESNFFGYTGAWFVVNGAGHAFSPQIFNVQDPFIEILTWDSDALVDVTGKSVPAGTHLRFRITTNLNQAVNPVYRSPLNPATDGFIDITVKDPSAAVFTSLYNDNIGSADAGPHSLTANYVDASTWYWGESGSWSWDTGALDDANNPVYPAGAYTISATSSLHGMNVHYPVSGKTSTPSHLVTILSGGGPAMTRQQAIDYGVANYFGGNAAGNGNQDLQVSDGVIPASTVITLLDGTTITSPPYASWLLFINEDKNANWGHTAHYAFISDNTVVPLTTVQFPPVELPAGVTMKHEAGKLPNPAGLTTTVPPFVRDPACPPDATNNYALLISGGGAKETNYARYYNDIAFLYKTLVKDYHYDKSHIKVVMSDGSSSTTNLLTGYDANNVAQYGKSPADLDGDGTGETWTGATKANVQTALSSYNSLSSTSNLLIFTTGHGELVTNSGGDGSSNAVNLLLWGTGVKITDAEFNTALQTPARVSLVMEQCYAGGFKNDLVPSSGTKTRMLTAAAAGTQSSHSNDFSYFWITGVAGHDSASNPANADADNSGQVSMREGYTYAYTWDPSGPRWANVESPMFYEYASGSGATQYPSACAATKPTITLTSPASGTNWAAFTKYTIKWTSANLPTSPAPVVKVELREGAGEGYWQADINRSVLASAGTTGVAYTVPASLPAGAAGDYWVKVSTIGSISPPVVGKSPNIAIFGVTKAATASLTINALPSAIATGSEILLRDSSGSVAKIGGVEQTGMKTPKTFSGLTSDTYTVTVSKACYYPSTVTVTLLPGGSQTKTLTLLGPITACTNGVSQEPYGSISITSVPEEGYEVYLDGTDMGYGTPVIQDIGTGPHTVTLKADGYQPQSKTVVVTAGGMAHADFTLVKLPEVKAQGLILPQPLNIGRNGYFVAVVLLPRGYKAAEVDAGTVSCEGAPAMRVIRLKPFPQVFAAIFKREHLRGVAPGERTPMSVVGTIRQGSGNYRFRATAAVNVISRKVNAKEDVDSVMSMSDSQVFGKFNRF